MAREVETLDRLLPTVGVAVSGERLSALVVSDFVASRDFLRSGKNRSDAGLGNLERKLTAQFEAKLAAVAETERAGAFRGAGERGPWRAKVPEITALAYSNDAAVAAVRSRARMPAVTKEQQLAAVDDLLRNLPPSGQFQPSSSDYDAEGSAAYFGRFVAVVERVGPHLKFRVDHARKYIRQQFYSEGARQEMFDLLHELRAALVFDLGPQTAVLPPGKPYEYFNEVRKIVAAARAEVFFIDRYLDADVVEAYLPSAAADCAIRMLGGPARAKTLIPACKMYAKQYGASVEVRVSTAFHDRYLFIDRKTCYQSGASFKDGAKTAPAIIAPVVDAFDATWKLYDDVWNAGERVMP